jgi:hypothetical protein
VVVHAHNPSIPEVKAEGSQVQGQPWLHNEFKATWGYIEKLYLKKKYKESISSLLKCLSSLRYSH